MKDLLNSVLRQSTWTALVFSGLLLGDSAQAETIPADRRITWQGNVGVPGGIPTRTTIFTNVTGIDKTGATDVRSALQSIINACPSNQVVYLPAGTYRINGPLVMKEYMTLRGSGIGTVISYHGSADSIIKFGSPDVGGDPQWFAADERDVTSSPSPLKGDTSFVISGTTSKFAVGNLMTIDILNDPSDLTLVTKEGYAGQQCNWCGRENGGRLVRQTVAITNVSGNTISFSPPLYWNYTNTLAPKAIAFVPSIKWSGVEDLKVYANGTSGGGANFRMFGVANCWVKNVESDYCDGDHVTIDYSVRCEVRDSYFHDGYVHTSGQVESCVALRAASSGCLIENNIIRRGHVSIMLEWGASGNVIGYNVLTNGFDSNALNSSGFGATIFHGAHCVMNLFEGNMGTVFNQDGVWGSASHNTLFRNFWSGETWHSPPYTGRGPEQTNKMFHGFQGAIAVQLIWNTRFFNVVGNVLGSKDLDVFVRGYYPGPQSVGQFPAAYMFKWPERGRSYDGYGLIFSLGYMGGATDDPGSTLVHETLINHGNWDVATKAVKWDASIPDRSLPQSYYLSSKPAWWDSSPWPAIGPDLNPMVGRIPASTRWLAAQTGNQPPVVTANASPNSGGAPLVVSFSSAGSSDPEGATLSYSWTFGDGGISSASNPSHTYQNPGSYSARLTVSDGTNAASSSHTILVGNQSPIVIATASPQSGAPPLTVNFSSAGSYDPEGNSLTYSWNFGDGTPPSIEVNPLHVYQSPGDYTARLTASDGTNSVQSAPVAILAMRNFVSGLVAAYSFEETGTLVYDASGQNNLGTLSNAVRVSGKNGQGLFFNGSNALVTIPNSFSLALSSNLTMEAWVNPASAVAGWKPIVFKPVSASAISYVLQGRSSSSGAPSLGLYVSPTNLTGTAALPANTWSHVAATYDGATMRLFVNGSQVASRSQTGSLISSTEALTIGGNALFSAYWDGLVDDLRIYNRPLTATEIQSDMNLAVPTATRPTPPSNLRIAQ